MRICFIVESGTDVRLVDGLADLGSLTVLARRIEGGVEISQAPSRPMAVEVGAPGRAAFARQMYRQLGRRRNRIDFVLVQGYAAAALAANLAGRRWGLRVAMLVCSPLEAYYRARRVAQDADRPFRCRELAALQVAARANARLGQRYVVLSEYLGRVVRTHGTRLPVDVVPVYGVDLGVFRPPQEPRAALRERRGLPADGALLFFSSRVAPEKDAETLLRALRVLSGEGRAVRVLHRSGGYRRFVELAARHGVEDRIIASDAAHPLRELPDDYAASDVCVQASREEGLGFSALEALACGTPVVAAAVGGLCETVREGLTGWTYPPGDAAGLARSIAAALDAPEEAARRAVAGRALVGERYERSGVFGRLASVMMEVGQK